MGNWASGGRSPALFFDHVWVFIDHFCKWLRGFGLAGGNRTLLQFHVAGGDFNGHASGTLLPDGSGDVDCPSANSDQRDVSVFWGQADHDHFTAPAGPDIGQHATRRVLDHVARNAHSDGLCRHLSGYLSVVSNCTYAIHTVCHRHPLYRIGPAPVWRIDFDAAGPNLGHDTLRGLQWRR